MPNLKSSKRLRPHRFLRDNPFAPYTEAIRSVSVAALGLPGFTKASKIIVVTSSIPGEGKTTLAVSMATYACMLKQRVLLIDFDFRNPGVLKALEGSSDLGIIDTINGLPLEQAIKTVPELGLDYLPSPTSPVDPLAIIAAAGLPELLKQARARYDCIIIDTAALLGTTEARLLSAMADEVLFAVRWGSTRREVVKTLSSSFELAWARTSVPVPAQ